jgi:hypothetical protein
VLRSNLSPSPIRVQQLSECKCWSLPHAARFTCRNYIRPQVVLSSNRPKTLDDQQPR